MVRDARGLCFVFHTVGSGGEQGVDKSCWWARRRWLMGAPRPVDDHSKKSIGCEKISGHNCSLEHILSRHRVYFLLLTKGHF